MATSTPQRRSHADWMSLLEEVFDEATDSRSRSVPFSELANLLLSFQTKKGHVMLQPKELEALDQYALDNALDFEVGPQDLMGILVQFGAADSPARQAVDDSALDQATPTHSTLQQPFGDSDGSPRSRIRTLSPTNYLDTANSPSTSTPQRPSKLPKRRSFLAALSSAGSPARSSPNAPTDLTEIVVASRETYLGVSLDGPLGEGWDPETLAIAIRAATKGLGTKEKELITILADKTFPQIRSIDLAYSAKYSKSLPDLISGEKLLRGNMDFALRGLTMGPLSWDAELVKKAVGGTTNNDTLLIELLVGRPPSAIALLRLAYSHRISVHDSPSRQKSLDSAVLSAYATNTKLKKAWEIVLAGKWDDMGNQGDERENGGKKSSAAKLVLLQEDVDQLKVALRKGGNHDVVTKIILARSPAHLHLVTAEFLKSGRTSLTRAIKDNFSGTIAQLLLYAVENGKKDRDAPGIWRDAKLLENALQAGSVSRNDALTWRLIRLHWHRARFLRVLSAFRLKFKKPVLECIHSSTTGHYRDLLKLVITSASLPEPIPSALEERRFEQSGSRSSTSSESGQMEADDLSSVLEADGELSNPSSLHSRSPPPSDLLDTSFPFHSSSSDHDISSRTPSPMISMRSDNSAPPSPTQPVSPLASFSNTPISSLSARQRSAPLDTNRPPSSTGSDARKPSFVRSRPIAPSRARRTSSDVLPRSASTEPTSPLDGDRSFSPLFARNLSPVWGNYEHSAGSPLDGGSMSWSAIRSSPSLLATLSDSMEEPLPLIDETTPNDPFASPQASIDTTSYHSRPLSPSPDTSSPTPLGLMQPSLPQEEDSSRAFDNRSGEAEQIRLLQKEAYELDKKYKGAQERLESSSAAFESEQDDLQIRLEEARSELAIKKREEKDLRYSEKQHLDQILSLEADVARAEKQLERTRELHAALKHDFEDQSAEAERLRSLAQELREDHQAATETISNHALQTRQHDQDLARAQATISKLEKNLEIARAAQDALDDQKQENLVLRETIDRLRFDMEELRATGSKNGDSENNSSFPSLTRNLGREIAEKLAKNAAEAASAVEAAREDEDVETVVTTRRITKRANKVVVSSDSPLHLVEPVVTVLHDVDVQTDSRPTNEIDVQTDLSAVNIALVPFVPPPVVEPIAPPPPKTRQTIQEELARELGVELSTFDEFIAVQKRVPPPPTTSAGLRQRNNGNRWGGRFSNRLPYVATQAPSYFINVFPESTRPYVSSIITSKVVLYTAVIYLGGVISGALFMPATHYHVSPYHLMVGGTDQAAWHQYNSLGTAWGEGMASGGGNGVGDSLFRFVNELVWGGVSVIRRVPV